jgi:HlyD family secretion protein
MTGRRKFYWLTALVVAGALVAAYEMRTPTPANSLEAASPTPKEQPAESADVGCAGRIEPPNGLVHIAARDPSGGIALIDGLAITEQHHISKGQPIGTLRGRSMVEASLNLSTQRITTAQLKLEQLRAAPKEAELASHSEEIARRQADYDHASKELARYEQLRKTQDVSASDVEARRTTVEMARRSLAEAHEDRKALGESREQDAAVLISEIREAEAERAKLQAELQLYTIVSPASGLVLKVFVHNGETVGPDGVAEVLEDGPLYVIAEVAEADIFRVKVGQKATVKGELLPVQLEGVVESIGRVVAGSQVLTSDPSAFTDKRIVPVKIRLSAIEPTQALIHARVSILIHT